MVEEAGGIISWIKELGPWVISFVALLQVWIIALWSRIRKGSVEIYESGNIEIGYSSYGSTVSLTGTLRCLYRDVFIKQVMVVLSRERDNAQCDLAWRAFKPLTISLSGAADQQFGIVSSFPITQALPLRYNIFFADDKFISEYHRHIDPLAQKWVSFAEQRLSDMDGERSNSRYAPTASCILKSIADEFLKIEESVEAYTWLDRRRYWESGRYFLKVKFETVDPNSMFLKVWSFTVSEEDTKNLRYNSISILKSLCSMTSPFNFAFPEYQNGQSSRFEKI